MPTVTRQTNTVKNAPKVSANGAVSAWDLADKINALIYGESATGKTTLWATFPGPILALICSGGSRPGELRSINTPEYRKKINPVVIDGPETYREQIGKAGEYATVVLDHAGGFSDMVLSKEIMMLDTILTAKYRQAGKGESWSVVSQQQYGQLAILLKEHFRVLLDLNANVVIVAHERIFKGKEETGVASDVLRPMVGAALTPSVAGWLHPACDYVLQTFKRPKMNKVQSEIAGQMIEMEERGKGIEYCLRTEPHETFMTKFRVPRGTKLPDVIVDPTYEKIAKIIKGG